MSLSDRIIFLDWSLALANQNVWIGQVILQL